MPDREIRLDLDLDTDETIALAYAMLAADRKPPEEAWLRRALGTLAAKIHRALPETPNLPQDAR